MQRKESGAKKRTSPPRDKLPAQPPPHKKSARYVKPEFTPTPSKSKDAHARSNIEGICYDLEFDYRPVLVRGHVEYVMVDIKDLERLHQNIDWERE